MDRHGTALIHQSLASIVSADARAATIFDRLGLDYCCRGHATLEDAAKDRNLDVARVLDELDALGPAPEAPWSPAEWPDLSFLTRHIVEQHHSYIRQISPVIKGWLDKLVSKHGGRHPELVDVRSTFDRLSDEISRHMVKEENILFPFVDAMAAAARTGESLPAGPFGTVVNPVRVMEEEHRVAGDLVAHLRTLTDSYQPPPDGCRTFHMCYEELARYESDLHRHVHLENTVLFPRAVELERQLA